MMNKTKIKIIPIITLILVLFSMQVNASINADRALPQQITEGQPFLVRIFLSNDGPRAEQVSVIEKIEDSIEISGPVNVKQVTTGVGSWDRTIQWEVTVSPFSTLELNYTATKRDSTPLTAYETRVINAGNQQILKSVIVQTTCKPNGQCQLGESYATCPNDCAANPPACTKNSDCSIGVLCGQTLYYEVICASGECRQNSAGCQAPAKYEPTETLEAKTLLYYGIVLIGLVILASIIIVIKGRRP